MSGKRPAVRRATPQLLERVATRFRALAEPARLAVLHALEDGERTVTELVELTGLAQGNLSKHLQQLYFAGFVTRRRDGLYVQYALADDGVLQLCALMCDRLDDGIEAERAVLRGARRR